MNDAVFGIVIGAVATTLPSIVSAIVSSVNSRAQRKHDLRMKYYDCFLIPKLNAIEQYREKLGKCIMIKSCDEPSAAEVLREYYAAYEIAYPHVSKDTQRAMSALDDPTGYSVSDDSIDHLNALLSEDIAKILAEGCSPKRDCKHK